VVRLQARKNPIKHWLGTGGTPVRLILPCPGRKSFQNAFSIGERSAFAPVVLLNGRFLNRALCKH